MVDTAVDGDSARAAEAGLGRLLLLDILVGAGAGLAVAAGYWVYPGGWLIFLGEGMASLLAASIVLGYLLRRHGPIPTVVSLLMAYAAWWFAIGLVALPAIADRGVPVHWGGTHFLDLFWPALFSCSALLWRVATRRRVAWVAAICLLAVAACIAIALAVSGLGGFLVALGAETPFRESTAEEVVSLVERGSLTPDPYGQVPLPAHLKSASCDGAAYVSHTVDGNLLVFFPSWLSRGLNVHGYLWSRRPLHWVNSQGQAIGEPIEVVAPYQMPDSSETARPLEVWIDRQIARHWYRVVHDLG